MPGVRDEALAVQPRTALLAAHDGATLARPFGQAALLTGLPRPTGPAARIPLVKVLLVSADPKVREMMELCVRGVQRSLPGEPLEFIQAKDGVAGIKAAWRHRPQVVEADEITSRAGAFALAKDLKGAVPAHPAR